MRRLEKLKAKELLIDLAWKSKEIAKRSGRRDWKAANHELFDAVLGMWTKPVVHTILRCMEGV